MQGKVFTTEKFEKEFLNADNCMEDMKYWIKGEAILYLRDIVFLSVWAIFLSLPAILAPEVGTIIIAVIFWTPALIYIVGASCLLLPYAIRVKKRAFSITEDTLTGTSDAVDRKGKRFHLQWKFLIFNFWIAFFCRDKYCHHYFHFEEHGRYEGRYLSPIRTVSGEKIRGKNFIWSQRYRMGDALLSQSVHSGEKFYLLTYETGRKEKKTKVAFIYPQKFFAWEDR